ncbi:SDR family NAD(P)-dependent oxidoreductase [Micromonospora chersina]|uniref:SDR family NAD(P)-dependent oxidoreductase n=1 Tax=Micromonospora chersina TaxID=47854 RepID=UPI00379C0B6B
MLVVTGGTQGTGLAFAHRAAAEGVHVVVGARGRSRGDQAIAEIRNAGGSAFVVPSDVTVEEEMARLVDTAVSEFGHLDGAFNNAGGGPMAGVRETDSDSWHRSLARQPDERLLRLEAPASGGSSPPAAARPSTPPLRLRRQGRRDADRLQRGEARRHRSHPVGGLDVARSRVRVNALFTGLIDTPLWRGVVSQQPATAERYLSMQPTGRAGTSDEVAALTAFLLSDEATFVTGAAIAIDRLGRPATSMGTG